MAPLWIKTGSSPWDFLVETGGLETDIIRPFPKIVTRFFEPCIGSDNGLVPTRRQAIIWFNDGQRSTRHHYMFSPWNYSVVSGLTGKINSTLLSAQCLYLVFETKFIWWIFRIRIGSCHLHVHPLWGCLTITRRNVKFSSIGLYDKSFREYLLFA